MANVPFGVSARGRRSRIATPFLLASIAAALLAGCGDDPPAPAPVSVALDFTPNAVHAPIYEAIDEGLDREQDVRLRIIAPGSSPDSLKSVLTGRADIGVLDIHDLGLALTRGRDLVAVGALVQRPLDERANRHEVAAAGER